MTRNDLIDTLIEDHGTLFSEEIGADIARDEPQQLFFWLLGALLMSSRISAGNAVEALQALKADGTHKIDAIKAANRQHLVSVLNHNGYARFDNQGADYIRGAARLVDEHYGGDLRRLRDRAETRDGILDALTEVKGIGQTGAAIFAREAQIAWDPLYPMMDEVSAGKAGELGLPDAAGPLSEAAGSRERFTRLVAALVRVSLNGPTDRVKEAVS